MHTGCISRRPDIIVRGSEEGQLSGLRLSPRDFNVVDKESCSEAFQTHFLQTHQIHSDANSIPNPTAEHKRHPVP